MFFSVLLLFGCGRNRKNNKTNKTTKNTINTTTKSNATTRRITTNNNNTTRSGDYDKNLLFSPNNPNMVIGVKNKTVEEIVVPDFVTEIACGAFSGCSNLKSITIPFVGDKAHTFTDDFQYPFGYIFGRVEYDNSILAEQNYPIVNHHGRISSPDSVYALYYLPKSLENVTITTTDYIQSGAFTGCTNLKNIYLNDCVKTIGWCAFSRCDSLNLKKYNNGYYLGNDISEYYYLVDIEEDAETLVVADGCKYIYDAEYSIYDLESIIIPNSVDFVYTRIYVNQKTEYGNAYYVGNTDNPYQVLVSAKSTDDIEGDEKTYIVHENCKAIAPTAFSGANNNYNIVIPKGLKSVGYNAFYFGGIPARNVYYNGTIEDWCNISFQHFHSGVKPRDVNPLAWSDFYLLNGNGITNFNGKNYNLLTGELVIPDGITEIGYAQFTCYDKITSLIIPDSVKKISDSAFYYCENLVRVSFGNNIEKIGDDSFSYCSIEDIILPDSLESLGRMAFSKNNIKKVKMPTNLDSISDDFFGYFPIDIPDDAVDYNGGYYIGNDENPYFMLIGVKSGVESLIISDKCEIVYSYYGDSLNTICIPKSLKYVNYDQSGLRVHLDSVYYDGSIEDMLKIKHFESTMASNAAKGGNNILRTDELYLKKSNGEYIFNGNKYVLFDGNLIIPDTIDTISDWFFIHNTGMISSIIISKSLKKIGYLSFFNARGFDYVYYEGTQEEFANIGRPVTENETETRFQDGLDDYADICFYSEIRKVDPNGEVLYWHYVNNVPTIWE